MRGQTLYPYIRMYKRNKLITDQVKEVFDDLYTDLHDGKLLIKLIDQVEPMVDGMI